jgi:Fe2+ or Zn2+ uptake regulation protein
MSTPHEGPTSQRTRGAGTPGSGGAAEGATDLRLREALEANGQRFTEQRASVYRFLRDTSNHPTADDVFTAVRQVITDISLATVYKSLETLVSCGLASKLTYGDGSARYDGCTDPHPHARCLECGTVLDLPGRLDASALAGLGQLPGFSVEGCRVEVVGVCHACRQGAEAA